MSTSYGPNKMTGDIPMGIAQMKKEIVNTIRSLETGGDDAETDAKIIIGGDKDLAKIETNAEEVAKTSANLPKKLFVIFRSIIHDMSRAKPYRIVL